MSKSDLYKKLSGEEFNKLYKNKKLYKLTNELELHNGFQYYDGLNCDTVDFNPNSTCSAGDYILQN